MNVVVMSKSDCPFCDKAKEHLAGLGIAYIEERYDDTDERQRMYDRLGLVDDERRVPQILVTELVDGVPTTVDHIKGYGALVAYDMEYRLAFD
jgi:glutaredoxin